MFGVIKKGGKQLCHLKKFCINLAQQTSVRPLKRTNYLFTTTTKLFFIHK